MMVGFINAFNFLAASFQLVDWSIDEYAICYLQVKIFCWEFDRLIDRAFLKMSLHTLKRNYCFFLGCFLVVYFWVCLQNLRFFDPVRMQMFFLWSCFHLVLTCLQATRASCGAFFVKHFKYLQLACSFETAWTGFSTCKCWAVFNLMKP